MMIKKINRRELRQKVLQILYAFEMNGEGLSLLRDSLLSDVDDKNDKDFCHQLVDYVLANKKDLDKQIGQRVDNWEMNRIALIDKILLRMGIAEILFFPDIPPKVSINEVIEISKDFSTPNSGKFINGILDTILVELKKTGKLNKSGRGLIDITLRKPSGFDK
jgi:transcription antitermination protein NusB